MTFGRELESIMGVAARYATANLEAMEQLPWSASECRQIQAQWQWVQGIPEVPGGYFTPRHFDFAFRDVLNDSSDPGETLEDAVKIINAEITAKRREFHIEDAE